MHQMQTKIIRLRRGDDLNTRNPPQGVGTPILGFRNRTEGNWCKEVSLTKNRASHPSVPNAVIMDGMVEDKMMINERLQHHQVILQEDLYAYGP